MPDVHEQAIDEIVAGIKGLKLPGIPAEEVRKRRLEHRIESDGRTTIHNWERGITVFPMQEVESAGTNLREDIGYGVGVVIAIPTDSSQSAGLGRALEIRAKIRRKFIHQRLGTVSLSGGMYLTTKVQHLPINQPREANQYEASSLLIRCWMREPRG